MTQPTTEQAEPDLGELPNFLAIAQWIEKREDFESLKPVLKWIGKLESWCKAAHDEHRHYDEVMDDHKHEIENLTQELGNAQGERDAALRLVEVVEDIDRGICDMDDLKRAIGELPGRD